MNDKLKASQLYREKVASGEIIKENKSLRKSIKYMCVSCMGN